MRISQVRISQVRISQVRISHLRNPQVRNVLKIRESSLSKKKMTFKIYVSMPHEHEPTLDDYYKLPTKLRQELGVEMMPDVWRTTHRSPDLDSGFWDRIVRCIDNEQTTQRGLTTYLANYFGVSVQTVSKKLNSTSSKKLNSTTEIPTGHATGVATAPAAFGGRGYGHATDPAAFAGVYGHATPERSLAPSLDSSESSYEPSYDCSSLADYKKLEQTFRENVFPENQCRDRTHTFMANGPSYPLSNIEYTSAPVESVDPSVEPVPDSVFSDNGAGFAIVSVDIPVGFGSLKDLDTSEGNSLFLDLAHGSEDKKLLKQAVKTHRHDPKRVILKASGDSDQAKAVSKLAEKVHEQLVRKMPQTFLSFDQGCRTYLKDHAAALASMEGALRQPVHVDNHAHPAGEGYSVLVAVESDVRLIVLKNSHALTRRISQLWEQWKVKGMIPIDTPEEEWWDFTCWNQLIGEGWGTSKKLEAITVVIPKGHALIFSSFLMHAGAGWEPGDLECFNRLHFYMTPFLQTAVPDVVNMHERGRIEGCTSFSPALRFLPRPSTNPVAADIPIWTPEQRVLRTYTGKRKLRT